MATSVTSTTSQFTFSHTTENSGQYSLLLSTQNTFVDKNIAVVVDTPVAITTSDAAGVSVALNTAGGTSATNIHGVLSSTNARPTASTDYYIALSATGSGSSAIDQSGWITAGTTLPTTTTNSTFFYKVTKGSGSVSNNVAVTTTVAITPTNVTTSSTDNGIKIVASGSSTASGSITATIGTAGYLPTGTMATASVSTTKTSTATFYLTGVTMPNNKAATFTVTASSNTYGTVKVAAYASSTDTATLTAQEIMTNGVWKTNSIEPKASAQGPYYGKTTVAATTTSGYTAANIRSGATIVVKGGNTNIYSVAGTFSSTSTLTGSKTGATAAQILDGYAAFLDGAQVNGTMANRGNYTATITTQNGKVTLSAGYYSGGTITATLPTTSITQRAWSKNATSKIISTTYANWGAGYVASAGNIPAVTFLNAPASGVTYTDLTDALTSTANGGTYYLPEVTNSRYIYISRGYIDNVSIDIGRFIPDITTANAGAAANHILQDKYAYDEAGNLLHGTIPSITAVTYNVSTSDRTIAAGNYIAGAQTIKAVTTTGIAAANIKYNIVMRVGDSNSAGRIKNITGTFSHTSTLTDSKTGAAAAQILSGYAAFLNGAQVNGDMANNGAINITITTQSQTATIPAGYTTGGTVTASLTTGTLAHNASNLAITKNDTAQSGTNPFSIYTNADTHGITIATATTTAVMGTNKVFIRIDSSGSVKCQTAGWIAAGTTKASNSLTRYVAMNYYTGGYSVTEG